jgi:hypothetical protein
MTGSNPVIVTAGLLPRAALLCDVSGLGLGLVTTFAPPVGSVLPVWLPGRPGEPSELMLVNVVHVRPTSDSLYHVGTSCHDEASSAALRQFVARLGRELE